MSSISKPSDININYKSISCENIPELFLDKIVAKNHFSKFGKINKFILRPRRLQCTVDFEQEEHAKAAILNGSIFNGHEFDIKFTENGVPQVRNTEEWVDPDIQSELEAMGSGAQKQYRTAGLASSLFAGKFQQAIMRLPKPILKNKTTSSTQPLTTDNINETRNLEPNDQCISLKHELETILRKQALSSAEKYSILEARDKYIRLTMSKTTDIKKAVSTKGTCPDMCPEKERLLRETRDQISSFELDKSGSLMDQKIAIKEYARSSADQESPLAHELRPERVLKMTMAYLLCRIMDLCDDENTSIGDWFHFVWDRTRSIRKDITQQELCSVDVVELIEQCARFHIHCAARLIAEDLSVFDQKINTENLTKCLQSLKYMYHDLRIKNIKCQNEPEFRAYIVLLNLNDSNFLWEVKQLPDEIRKSEEMKEAINFYSSVENNNFVKFFKMLRKTSYMNSCILMRYFNQVRNSAIRTIIKAYTSSRQNTIQMPLSYLTNILAFESIDDAVIFFDHYKIECDYDKVTLEKNWNYIPDMSPQLDRCLEVVESKRTVSVGESICGKPLNSTSYFENHSPHNSFDDHGYLKQSAWTADDQNDKNSLAKSKSLTSNGDSVFKIPINSPPISPKQHQNQQIKSLFGLPQKKIQNLFTEEVDNSEHPKKATGSIFESNKLSPISISTPIFGPSSLDTKNDIAQTSIFGSALSQSENQIFEKLPDEDKKVSIFPKKAETSPSIFGSNTALKKTALFGKQSQKFSPIFNTFQTEHKTNFIKDSESPCNEASIKSSTSPSIFSNSKLQSISSELPMFSSASKNIDFENQTPHNRSQFDQNFTEVNSDYGKFSIPKTDEISVFQNIDQKQDSNKILNQKSNRKRKSENDESSIQETEDTHFSPVFSSKKLFTTTISEEETNNVKEEIRKKEEENERKSISEYEKLRKEEEHFNLLKKSTIEKNAKRILSHMLQEVQDNLIQSIVNEILLKTKRNKDVEIKATKIFEGLCSEVIEECLKEVIQYELEHYIKYETILRKYFLRWRNSTIKSTERRQLIQETLNWAVPENIDEIAKRIAHPAQNLNLEMIHRYRLGIPKVFNLLTANNIKKINIISVLSKELETDNTESKIFGRMKSRKYVKLVISLPSDSEEMKGFDSYVNSLLDKTIERVIPREADKGFMCEQDLNVAVCIQTICGKPNNVTIKKCDDLNGLIFFLTLENLYNTHRRLICLLRNSKVNISIPVVLLVYKNTHDNTNNYEIENVLALHELQHLKRISTFKIFEFNDDNIRDVLTNTMTYLAKNINQKNELEMQNFVSFLQATLANEVWKRFYDSWLINFPFQVYCTRPENVVNLYNAAIDKLIDLFKEDLSKYPELPHELTEFVPNIFVDVPKEYEYFSVNWKKDLRNTKVINFLKKLRLRDIKKKWTTNLQELEKVIMNYSKNCLYIISEQSGQTAGYSAIKILLEKLNNPELINTKIEDKFKQLSWLEVLRPIALELLSQVWKAEQNVIPKEVIYRKDKYYNFLKLPWWLKDLQSTQLTLSLEDENLPKNEDLVDDCCGDNNDQNNLDLVLNRGYDLIERARENIDKYHNYLNLSREISKNLDISFYKLDSEKSKLLPHLKQKGEINEKCRKKFKPNENYNSNEIEKTITKALSVIEKYESRMDFMNK